MCGIKVIEVKVSDVASREQKRPGVGLKEKRSSLSWRYVQFRPHFLVAAHLPQIRSVSRQVVNAGSVVANTDASFPKSCGFASSEHESTRNTENDMPRVNEAEIYAIFLYKESLLLQQELEYIHF